MTTNTLSRIESALGGAVADGARLRQRVDAYCAKRADATIYNTYTRKSDKDPWQLSFVNKHHVIVHRKEEFAKSRGLQVKTEIVKDKPK